MAKTVYSDNQNNVDALAERLSSQTSLSAERAKLVAYDLLCRKALKIKSSALAQIFRSVDKECDTKAMRDELIAAKIVTKIEGSGINGRPAFYTINAEINDVQEQPVEVAEETVEDVVEAPASVETAPREHVDTDELLDESVVRAFTAKAGRGGFGGGGKRDAQRRAQQERFRRAVAQKDELDTEAVETEVAVESQKPAQEQKPVKVQEPKRCRGAHFKAAQQDVAHEVEEPSEVADDAEESAKRAPGSCRPGRGFAGRAYPVKHQEKGEPASTAQAEKAEQTEKTVEPVAREQQPSESQPAADTEVKAQQSADKQVGESASSKPRRRRHRGGRGSNAETVAEKATQNKNAKAETPVEQPKRQPARGDKPERSQKGPSAPKQERKAQVDSKRKSQAQSKPTANDVAAQQTEPPAHGEVSAFALARVLGRQLLKIVPTPTALSKIKEQQTQIVKVEGKDGKKAPQRTQHNEMSNRKIAEEIAIIQAWI